MNGTIKFEYEETNGRTVIVREHELGNYPGWRLAAVIYTDRVEPMTEVEREQDQYGHHTGKVVQKEHALVVREPRFLLVQYAESAIAELTEERDIAQRGVLHTEQLFRGAEAKAAQLERDLAEEAKKLTHEKGVTAQLRKDADEDRTRRRKLEGDIGKIRVAIGEKQMKEIIDPQ